MTKQKDISDWLSNYFLNKGFDGLTSTTYAREIFSELSNRGLAFVYDIQAPAFGKQWAKFEPLIKES